MAFDLLKRFKNANRLNLPAHDVPPRSTTDSAPPRVLRRSTERRRNEVS